MTRHEAHALVLAAVGDLSMVRRIDYVVDAGGEGVVVTVETGMVTALKLETLTEMTVEEYRQYFLVVLRNTERQAQLHASGGGDEQCRCAKPEDVNQ